MTWNQRRSSDRLFRSAVLALLIALVLSSAWTYNFIHATVAASAASRRRIEEHLLATDQIDTTLGKRLDILSQELKLSQEQTRLLKLKGAQVEAYLALSRDRARQR